MRTKQELRYVFVNPNEDGVFEDAFRRIIVEKLRSQAAVNTPPSSQPPVRKQKIP